MRYRLLILFLFSCCCLHAQDTITVKRQANIIADATFKGDFKTVIEYTHPSLIKLSGGEEQMQKLITERIKDLKSQGIISFTGWVEAPGKFYKAGDDIHCLLPEQIILKTNAGRYLARSYMLGVSGDNGKTWKFLDVGNMPANVLHRLLPHFNDELKIPPPTPPEFLPN